MFIKGVYAMKKTEKNLLKSTLLIITSLSITLPFVVVNTLPKEQDNQQSLLQDEENLSFSPSNTTLKINSKNVFNGSILDENAVIALGWNQKTNIELSDWRIQAPNVTIIDAYAFNNANYSTQSIVIPNQVVEIRGFAFAAGPLRSITFEGNSRLQLIGHNSFSHTQIGSIIIPESVREIQSSAFSDSPLKEILFSSNNNLIEIGNSAFSNTTLTDVNIPTSVSILGNGAFAGTRHLVRISIPISLRGKDFDVPKYGFNQTQWITINWRQTTFTGTTLDWNAIIFLGWFDKRTINLSPTPPANLNSDWRFAPNVNTIGDEGIDISTSPFASSPHLRQIEIPSRIVKIGNNVFNGASSLTTITFENNSNLKSIGTRAFSNSGITSINIPDSVTTIARDSFANTSSLQGANISMSASLRQGSSTALYGFTQDQWNTINWRPIHFSGTILKKSDLFDIGWNNKEIITLEDWLLSAPNVTRIGDQNSTIDEAPFIQSTSLKSIEIPSKVLLIGDQAFAGARNLTTITFEPGSKLQTIRNNAFNSSGITSIDVPNSVTTIGTNAFQNTSNLLGQNVFISSTFRLSDSPEYGFNQNQWNNISWKPNAFNGETLTKDEVVRIGWHNKEIITLSDWETWAPNVTRIGNSASTPTDAPFFGNTFLKSIEIPSRIIMIGNNAFASSVLSSITIPDSVVTIGTNAFQNTSSSLQGRNISILVTMRQNSISELYGFTRGQWDTINWRPIPFLGSILTKNDVINIGWHNKETITLEDWSLSAPNVTIISDVNSTIDNAPFSGNTILRSIAIPSRIISINNNAFRVTSNLTTITFEQNSRLTTIGNNVFTSSGITSINIPNTVISIGNDAFSSISTSGINISMLSTLRQNSFAPLYGLSLAQWDTIDWRGVEFIGTSLTRNDVINIGWRDKELITLEDWALWAPNVTRISDEVTSNGTFAGSISLKSIEIPDKITTIGNNTFVNSGITSINLPNSVTSIGLNAFQNTIALEGKNITMLASLRQNSFIPLYGFTEEQWDTINWMGIQYTGTILTKNDVINIGWSNKETITLDDWSLWAPNVNRIGDDVSSNGPFAGNRSLKSIEIPNQITTIGNNAFAGSGITSINIPNSIVSIGINAFLNTFSLEGKTVTMLSILRQNSFTPLYGFTALQWDSINWTGIRHTGTTLTKNDVINIGWSNKETITLIDWTIWAPNVTQIGDDVSSNGPFAGNTFLKSIEIPTQVTSIGNNAFEGSKITSINIPSSIISIGTNAFLNTFSLEGKNITMPITLNMESTLPLYGFSQTQWNEIIWTIFSSFEGTVLTRQVMIDLGWNTKETISLADWNLQAPNVTEIGSNNVTSVDQGAFANITSLTSIEIPSRIRRINSFSFLNTTALTSITFDDEKNSKLEIIANSAFENSAIRSISIPNSVRSIGTDCFKGTNSLLEINIPHSLMPKESDVPRFGLNPAQWSSINWINIPPIDNSLNYIIFGTLSGVFAILAVSSIVIISLIRRNKKRQEREQFQIEDEEEYYIDYIAEYNEKFYE
ncbi:MAG: leucine-rich repeat protein [Metamycoplasmataceae bacterium]